MNESILKYWNRIKQYATQTWTGFSKSQKTMFISMILLLLIAIPLLVSYFSRTEYELAFTDLQPSDATSIKGYLSSANIPYKLENGGTSISVPRSKVDDVKIEVESQGLNQGGSIGYEALGSSSMFGSTDREFDVKQLSMLQGEMQKMLNSFDAVAGSKVMITLPERSVFITSADTDQSSAAVVLKLKPGYRLDQQKVDTMYQLVSKSVKNLPIDNITISEQNGDLLPYSKSDSNLAVASNAAAMQFQIKKQFEADIQKNIMNMLSKVMGPDKVVPVVVASMNFDQKVSKQNLVKPVVDDHGIAISMQQIQKSYTGTDSSTGGIAGTGSTDIPTYPSDSGTGTSTQEDNETTTNWEINRINNEIQSSPFFINDLTISIGVEPPDPKNPDSLTADNEASIKSILKQIVASSTANREVPFTDAELNARVTLFKHEFAASANVSSGKKTNWLLYGSLAGAVALLLGGVGGYMISKRRRKAEEQFVEPVAPARQEYQTLDLDSLDAKSGEAQVRKQLEMLAKKKPEEFVNLLRTWLVDE
ncbi:flagellar basal-body MS-ring/collar protein FliF [Gorillibacterium massiliense]|uniref:flagellar basal-body MS-ring/collar protein FliF n=1 Tax=Gorillibacterium massiliense TaxID=1280390 RepID=UPI0004BABC76|nr:flagellar basal-body MS-ring/collar protein FliF [Gorillibacterium massiliense]